MKKLLKKDTIFFDFDGVIKDSMEVKSDAFELLFLPFGKEVAKKVRKHHEENGGMSRFEKLPLYLSWASLNFDQKIIDEYSNKFSSLVMQSVIKSEWVPGILNFLKKKNTHASLFVITATPQAEIEEILNQLAINHYFKMVVGAPTPKSEAIRLLIDQFQIQIKNTVMIGDSTSDYQAASLNQVDFVLRRTKLNRKLQNTLECSSVFDCFDDFIMDYDD